MDGREVIKEIAKLVNHRKDYDIFIAKNLNNDLKEIMIRPRKR